MINVERVANAIENAAYNAEHLDQEYPMQAEAKAAINDVLDQLIEIEQNNKEEHFKYLNAFIIDWLQSLRSQK